MRDHVTARRWLTQCRCTVADSLVLFPYKEEPISADANTSMCFPFPLAERRRLLKALGSKWTEHGPDINNSRRVGRAVRGWIKANSLSALLIILSGPSWKSCGDPAVHKWYL